MPFRYLLSGGVFRRLDFLLHLDLLLISLAACSYVHMHFILDPNTDSPQDIVGRTGTTYLPVLNHPRSSAFCVLRVLQAQNFY